MTREEAINHLKTVAKSAIDSGYDSAVVDAVSMAVKALEQDPCGKDINVPATDAISRQAVLEVIDAKAWEFCDYLISESRNEEQKPVSHFADNLRECISEDLPPVTPQQKTGHWIKDDITERSKSAYKHKCDRCGAYHRAMYDYCPSCGAKMEKEKT